MSTPLRRQYLDVKRRYPGMILLFQIGDFYETFDEDAQLLARELGVQLTRKWFGKGDVRPLGTRAAAALVRYLQESQPDALRNLTQLGSYGLDGHMQLGPDAACDLE